MSDTNTSKGPFEPAPARKQNVALIVSLCLNFVLVGLIAMAIVRVSMEYPMFRPGGGPNAGRGPAMAPGQILAPHMLMRVAPAEAGKIKGIVQAHRDQIAALRRDAFAARRDVMRTFAAPNFDQQAFEQSIQRVHQADSALEAEALNVVSESAITLTPDERRAVISQAWQHNGPRWRRRGHGPEF